MRDIKFRAWNSIDKVMCDNSTTLTNLRGFIKSKHYHPMQYAGLKDKNGVEIYEGDIILAFGCKLEIKWIVDGWFADCEVSGICEAGQEWDDNCEIIGNIHQNPELLGD